MDADSVKGMGGQVETALRRAAIATGVDFGFLVSTARRESGFNAAARAGTSTAAGLFQFVEQTWLATVKRHGAAHGYARYAALIEQASDGRYHVSGREARQAVMDLRFDPHAASVMAGALANDHAAYLRGRIGRDATAGELYAAHFLGPQGSARLIQAVGDAPNAPAAKLFPDAAAANRAVFYRGGRALSVAEVYNDLSQVGGQAPAIPEADPGEAAFAAYAGARRGERERQEAMLIDMLLAGSGLLASAPARENAVSGLFSAEILTLLAQVRQDP